MKFAIIVSFLFSLFICISLEAQKSYEEIDKHVLNLRKLSPEVTEITNIIIAPYTTEKEKARAIFTWIANNITVNANSYLKGKSKNINMSSLLNTGNEINLDAELNKVLKSKKALPSQYAYLFLRMCNIAGIKTVIVKGTLRMDSRLTGKVIKNGKDYWNVVFIDGKWYISDSFSGAGEINREKKKFIRIFRSEFYLIEPEKAIITHYPESEQNQYVKVRIKKEEINNFPIIGYGYLKYGASEYTPLSGIIQTAGQKALVIGIKFIVSPEKFFLIEGSQKTELQAFKNNEGFIFLGIDSGTRRNRIVTIAGKKGEEVYDIITYKIKLN